MKIKSALTPLAVAVAAAAAILVVTGSRTEAAPVITVYKSPTCGCCNAWVDHLREAGFEVRTEDTESMGAVKAELGVPNELGSCHTGVIEGYVVEGHVPADVIQRLLAERPPVAGIAVPGMPIGSPGMEGPNPQPYAIVAFDQAGNASVYDRR